MKKILLLIMCFLMIAQPVLAAEEKIELIVENEQNKISFKGVAECGGQNVIIQMLKPESNEAVNLDDIVFRKQLKADDKGAYSVAFSAPDNLKSGVYPVSFYYEDGQIVNKTFEFKSANDMSSDYKLLSQVKDATEVRQIVEQHGEEWDFDFSLYNILQEDAKKEVVNRFIALNGTKTDRITKAAEIFKDAVMVVAISAYQGQFSDLVTGIYGDYTGFAETNAYKKFATAVDLDYVGQSMRAQKFENRAATIKQFELEVCFAIIADSKSWYTVNQAIELLLPLLSLDENLYYKANEKICLALAGKSFTLEEFLIAYESEIQKNTGKKIIFNDVAEQTDWASASVNALYEAGIVNGVSEGKFDPNGNVTREQFAKMIVSMLGETENISGDSFSDVNANEWYAPYVAMAKESGIVNGVSETEFGVGQNITREQMATMIYRAGLLIGYKSDGTAKTFSDSDKISDYAKDAVDALTAGGVINGMADGSFAPSATATRAEAACMIYNMMCSANYTVQVQTGYQPISANEIFVTYKQNFNSYEEKEYKVLDKFSTRGWYLAPDGSSYLTISPAPTGVKRYEIPFEEENKQDMAVAIRVENSGKQGHFDTKPFPLSHETDDKMRLEMNLYMQTDSISPDYKVFNIRFFSYADERGSFGMPLFYFAGDNGVYYYDMNGKGVRCGDYNKNEWVHVAADFDAEKSAYTLYLNGVTVAKDIPYNTSAILWDGTDVEPAFRKSRLRMSVMPDFVGNSVTYIDDFMLARYTDAPFVLPETPKLGDSTVKVGVDKNVEISTLKYITVSVNGVDIRAVGELQDSKYVLNLPEVLKSGDVVAISVDRWLENGNGILMGTPKSFIYTVE